MQLTDERQLGHAVALGAASLPAFAPQKQSAAPLHA